LVAIGVAVSCVESDWSGVLVGIDAAAQRHINPDGVCCRESARLEIPTVDYMMVGRVISAFTADLHPAVSEHHVLAVAPADCPAFDVVRIPLSFGC
jgi:hypothetical protein